MGGVLTLPVLAALLAVASLPFAWLAWQDGYWGRPARLHYTAIVGGLLAFAWFLNQWNLLGWRFWARGLGRAGLGYAVGPSQAVPSMVSQWI